MPDSQATLVEQMLAGGLIATPERQSLLSSLQIDFDENMMTDPTSRSIVKAAKMAATLEYGNMMPTPENLVTIIIKEGLSGREFETPEQVAEFKLQAQSQMMALRDIGADSPAAINSLASAIQDFIRLKKLAAYARQATTIANDPSKTAQDTYYELSGLLEEARPGAVDARLYKLSEFKGAIRKFIQQQSSLIGQKLMTFPPEFWAMNYIPYMMPGLLYIVSGLTGRGKSSTLHQIADWLSRCGFRVLYFHPEDTIERQAMRVARRLTDASPLELNAGDPRGKFKQVTALLTERSKNNGGEIIWSHCINQPTSYIRMITQSVKPDVVIVDYVQKINIAPQMSITKGIEHAALGMVVEEMKQMAEDHRHQTVVILGSQEADYESGERKGTAGSRKIQWKSQFVVEFKRELLTEKDEPEVVDGVLIAGPGDLSGFGSLDIIKNNDGPTGRIDGVFHGQRQEFKALEYKMWERTHPGQMFPMATLSAPSEEYLRKWKAKSDAWDKLDMVLKPPKLRRKAKSKGESAYEGRKNAEDLEDEGTDVPF